MKIYIIAIEFIFLAEFSREKIVRNMKVNYFKTQ